MLRLAGEKPRRGWENVGFGVQTKAHVSLLRRAICLLRCGVYVWTTGIGLFLFFELMHAGVHGLKPGGEQREVLAAWKAEVRVGIYA